MKRPTFTPLVSSCGSSSPASPSTPTPSTLLATRLSPSFFVLRSFSSSFVHGIAKLDSWPAWAQQTFDRGARVSDLAQRPSAQDTGQLHLYPQKAHAGVLADRLCQGILNAIIINVIMGLIDVVLIFPFDIAAQRPSFERINKKIDQILIQIAILDDQGRRFWKKYFFRQVRIITVSRMPLCWR